MMCRERDNLRRGADAGRYVRVLRESPETPRQAKEPEAASLRFFLHSWMVHQILSTRNSLQW